MFFKMVVLDDLGQVKEEVYRPHHSNTQGVLEEECSRLEIQQTDRIVVTGSNVSDVFTYPRVNQVKALLEVIKTSLPEALNVIDIGGGSLTLIELDQNRNFKNFTGNSLCAAGTGSFLDEQAQRLGLTYTDISSFQSVGDPPSIATRCAVFAKSDLIHRQQEGYSKEAMWSGLCRGMAGTLVQTLLKGRPLTGKAVVIGGVALNQVVIHWLKKILGNGLVIEIPKPHLTAALGAAKLAFACGSKLDLAEPAQAFGSHKADQASSQAGDRTNDGVKDDSCTNGGHRAGGDQDDSCTKSSGRAVGDKVESCMIDGRKGGSCTAGFFKEGSAQSHLDNLLKAEANLPPLKLVKSSYPSFQVAENYVDDQDTEVRLSAYPAPGELAVYLGLDIGSTSTKAVLVNNADQVIADFYRRTAGNPIEATKKIFAAITNLGEKLGIDFIVKGVGSTGSGRKLIGRIIGADGIINEITAHVTGAMAADPEIDTIFEIGGQDSKYMHTRNGRIHDVNMNYACAAGTGSFVEEQAKKLGISLFAIGDLVMEIAPPRTSDRCTVFMEMDVHKLVRQGFSREECIAAVLCSVVQNYLNRVVGNRFVSPKKIFFQGATARNKGLVAAFENHLGVEMVVSPFCHVMGAYGVALQVKRMMAANQPSLFRGFDLSTRRIALDKDTCRLCHNYCTITYAHIAGVSEVPSWGYACGREPEADKMKIANHDDPVQLRERFFRRFRQENKPLPQAPAMHLPRTLTSFTFYPLWQKFFARLGWDARLSAATGETIKELGTNLVGADFCYPVKLAHGHAAQLLANHPGEKIFLPYMIANQPNEFTYNTIFCPYVESIPSTVAAALELNNCPAGQIISPVVDLRLSEKQITESLAKALAPHLNASKSQLRQAWQAAWESYLQAARQLEEEGAKLLEQLSRSQKTSIVLIGRPYNIYDPGANISLPKKIADYGVTVIPLDLLPFQPDQLGAEFANMYWSYGQRIIQALKYVRGQEHLFPVYLTNFNCGPDSFLLSYAEKLMEEKPILILEIDEHGADAGYLTRIEAFMDVIKAYQKDRTSPAEKRKKDRSQQSEQLQKLEQLPELKKRTLLIPPLHPIGSELFAAAFRGYGYQAEHLPEEDQVTLDMGKKVTRGSECLPTIVTIGGLLKYLQDKEKPNEHYAFFMPEAQGPCRFGQYHQLHRMILDREGYEGIPILSPSSLNAYQGLEESLRLALWRTILVSDILYKLGCRVRPYEAHPGETAQLLQESIKAFARILEAKGDLIKELAVTGKLFKGIKRHPVQKPLVGIVGEIYVRANHFSNSHVVKTIEALGGEAWLTPISEWILYTAGQQEFKAKSKGLIFDGAMLKSILKNKYLIKEEHDYYRACGDILAERHEPKLALTLEEGKKFIPQEFEGEAILTIGRASLFAKQGASLVVNCNPFGCMPGTIAAALFKKLEQDLEVPFLNIFYEGVGDENKKIEVFLHNINFQPDADKAAEPIPKKITGR
jgi:predicted CoA-substrate-specific enzyme activase